MQKITRRHFLGIGAKVGAASLVTGLFAPAPERFFGLGGGVHADGKKVTLFSFALITDSHIWDIPPPSHGECNEGEKRSGGRVSTGSRRHIAP